MWGSKFFCVLMVGLMAQSYASTLSVLHYSFSVGKITEAIYMPTSSLFIATVDSEFLIMRNDKEMDLLRNCFGEMPENHLVKSWVMGTAEIVNDQDKCLALQKSRGALPYESITILKDRPNEFIYLLESEQFHPVLRLCYGYICQEIIVITSTPETLRSLAQ
jgi:hypothetical protein